MDEIHRVMERGAVFGMIWNIDDCEIPYADSLTEHLTIHISLDTLY